MSMEMGRKRCLLMLSLLSWSNVQGTGQVPLKIVQIVPGFTNSHLLFNYRLAETLTRMGHSVSLWTQMEMNMVLSGVSQRPVNVSEHQVAIQFSDRMKTDGLKIFQTMMFEESGAFDLWWTGQEFKEMRIEACDQMLSPLHDGQFDRFRQEHFHLAIAHFHDLCPLAIAKRMNVDKIVWVTHGTSIFDFAAVQLGLRTIPSFIPHPLTWFDDRMNFFERMVNLAWYMSTLDFVNLPENLLYEENEFYVNNQRLDEEEDDDLWRLSANVNLLLINGERMLDFARPLPVDIAFMGEVGRLSDSDRILDNQWNDLIGKEKKGIILFSLGTVSNTSNMPDQMSNAFLQAFAHFPDYVILWRMEAPLRHNLSHLHIRSWLPQKQLLRDRRMALLIAHGGYNSLLETAQSGVPALLMPLFADQHINARRASRFGVALSLDKSRLSSELIRDRMSSLLFDPIYRNKARKLAKMLADKPEGDNDHVLLEHRLQMAMRSRRWTALAARRLDFVKFHNVDVVFCSLTITMMMLLFMTIDS